jgi:hypothetical protein
MSLTETITCAVVWRQPRPPESVVSAGLVTSTLTVSVRQSEALPASSTARVSSECVPEVGMVIVSPLPTSVAGPPSRIHCIWSTPDSVSVPDSATWYGAAYQPPPGNGVVLTGLVVSASPQESAASASRQLARNSLL